MTFENTIFISDFDGTLLTSDKNISSGNITAIKRYQQLGGKFTVATGRPIQTVESYIPLIDYDLPMIICNGAMIYDSKLRKIVWAEYLPDSAADIVKEIMQKFPTVAPEVYTASSQNCLRINETELWHQSLLGCTFNRYASIDEIHEPVCKLLFADDESVIDELCEYVKKFSGVRFVRSLSKFLEVLPCDVSKGTAVKVLKELYSLDGYKVFTAGDYDNDIEMLKASDISFCPSNSEECVKQAANVVLNATNDEDAIKEAISYLRSK